MADTSEGTGEDGELSWLPQGEMEVDDWSDNSSQSGSIDLKRAVSDLWNSSSEWPVVF